MLLDVDGTTYTVHLWYQKPIDRRRHTICMIHAGRCEDPVKDLTATWPTFCKTAGAVTGVAMCVQWDNFSRRAGRKIAFTRAVNQLLPKIILDEDQRRWIDSPDAVKHKKLRTKLWDVFLRKTNVVKEIGE